MPRRPRFPVELEAMDAPVPVYAWSGQEGDDKLAVIEQDVRGLLRDLARARAAVREIEQERDAEVDTIVLSIIEAVDAFDRVLENIDQRREEVAGPMKVWVGNFRTVHRLLRKGLAEHGIERMEVARMEFDPHLHAAVQTVDDGGRPEGTIAEVLRPGYIRRGRVIRRADVVVIAAPGTGGET